MRLAAPGDVMTPADIDRAVEVASGICSGGGDSDGEATILLARAVIALQGQMAGAARLLAEAYSSLEGYDALLLAANEARDVAIAGESETRSHMYAARIEAGKVRNALEETDHPRNPWPLPWESP